MRQTNPEAVRRLSRFVLDRRRRLNLTQSEVAERCGVSSGWVAGVESCRFQSPPRKNYIHHLANGMIIPGETPGALFNFLELVIAGSIAEDVIKEVARGDRPAAEAMAMAAQGVGVTVLPDTPQDNDQMHRLRRYHRVLSLLKLDLSNRDYVIAEGLLSKLYEVN